MVEPGSPPIPRGLPAGAWLTLALAGGLPWALRGWATGLEPALDPIDLAAAWVSQTMLLGLFFVFAQRTLMPASQGGPARPIRIALAFVVGFLVLQAGKAELGGTVLRVWAVGLGCISALLALKSLKRGAQAFELLLLSLSLFSRALVSGDDNNLLMTRLLEGLQACAVFGLALGLGRRRLGSLALAGGIAGAGLALWLRQASSVGSPSDLVLQIAGNMTFGLSILPGPAWALGAVFATLIAAGEAALGRRSVSAFGLLAACAPLCPFILVVSHLSVLESEYTE